MVSKYSWALPNEELLTEIASRSPIIEIGAGNGYWASLLSKKGADIIALCAKNRDFRANVPLKRLGLGVFPD